MRASGLFGNFIGDGGTGAKRLKFEILLVLSSAVVFVHAPCIWKPELTLEGECRVCALHVSKYSPELAAPQPCGICAQELCSLKCRPLQCGADFETTKCSGQR